MGTESAGEVGAVCNTWSTKGVKNHHGTIRDMMVASSHVLYLNLQREVPRRKLIYSALPVYSGRLIVVSARTNKRHHHHHHRKGDSNQLVYKQTSPGVGIREMEKLFSTD